MRQSGLQKDVTALYRKVLREAVKKDRLSSSSVSSTSTSSSSTSPTTSSNDGGCRIAFVALLGSGSSSSCSSNTSYAAAEFRRQAATVKRSDFKKVEYMIRKGHKQVKLLQMPGVKVVHGTHHTQAT